MKLVKQYKGFKIKQPSAKEVKDGKSYAYYIYTRDNELEWEADSMQEVIEFIDSY